MILYEPKDVALFTYLLRAELPKEVDVFGIENFKRIQPIETNSMEEEIDSTNENKYFLRI